MHIELGLLTLGILGLWWGSEIAINGAKNIANHFRITSVFVGLFILSIGTSVPEMAVSIAGGIDRLKGIETSGLVVGNAVGSAVNQLTLILGIIGLIGILVIKKRSLFREGLMLLGSIVLLFIMGLDGQFTKFEGGILIVVYLMYLIDLTRQEKVVTKMAGRKPELHLAFDIIRLCGGLLLVAFASDYVVQNGIAVAAQFGLTQEFVGIFLVGLGTGLPELAISIQAIRKGDVAMSVGNLIGSNICDLLLSLGMGTAIAGFLVPRNILLYDLPALLIISGTVLYLFRTEYKLRYREAALLIGMYVLYLSGRLYLFG